MYKTCCQLSTISRNSIGARDRRAATGFRLFMQIATCSTATIKKSCTKQFQLEFIITIAHGQIVLCSMNKLMSTNYTVWKFPASQTSVSGQRHFSQQPKRIPKMRRANFSTLLNFIGQQTRAHYLSELARREGSARQLP